MNEHPISLLRASRPHGALFIAGIYLLLGSLWILVSDPLAELVSTNADMLTTISILKGWCYVVVTALLLYWLIRRETTALRERESQLRLVTDAVPALIAYFDSQERLGFHNRVFDQWCGDLRGSPTDQTLQALLGPERYAPLAGYVRTALSGRESSFESGLACPGGPPRDLQISLIPDRDEDGLVKGFFALAADITGRKREEAEREELLAENQRHKALLDSIFEADPSALAVLEGPEKRIVFANPAYRFIVPDISQDP
ncbi:MAG TPA: PAS domain-containing protein, partial [Anaerolineaceae bacterium]